MPQAIPFIVAAATTAAGVTASIKNLRSEKVSTPPPSPVSSPILSGPPPVVPSPDEEEKKQRLRLLEMAKSRNRTILTSPLGLGSEDLNISRPILLGR